MVYVYMLMPYFSQEKNIFAYVCQEKCRLKIITLSEGIIHINGYLVVQPCLHHNISMGGKKVNKQHVLCM